MASRLAVIAFSIPVTLFCQSETARLSTLVRKSPDLRIERAACLVSLIALPGFNAEAAALRSSSGQDGIGFGIRSDVRVRRFSLQLASQTRAGSSRSARLFDDPLSQLSLPAHPPSSQKGGRQKAYSLAMNRIRDELDRTALSSPLHQDADLTR